MGEALPRALRSAVAPRYHDWGGGDIEITRDGEHVYVILDVERAAVRLKLTAEQCEQLASSLIDVALDVYAERPDD